MLKISTKGGKTYDGEIFAVDPVTKAIVLKNGNTFSVLNPNEIIHIDGNIALPQDPSFTQFAVTAANLEKKEHAALKQADKYMAALNKGVDSETQFLFDRISSFFPTKWDGTNMVVLDVYVIEPPYSAVRTLPGSDGSGGLERVSKRLEEERKKMKL